MDTLRQALGEPKVSYFGFSYGSELGATWATMFPDTVRAAVLDGAANPNVGWEAEKTEQAVGLERAFLTVMQSCAADPGCPFFNGGDPVSAYEALSASLDAAPVTGDPTRPPANESVLFYATLVALRDSKGWTACTGRWPRLRRATSPGSSRCTTPTCGARTALLRTPSRPSSPSTASTTPGRPTRRAGGHRRLHPAGRRTWASACAAAGAPAGPSARVHPCT
jgi:pimeloyl-ACP methyl ester carboxylesterase